MEVGSLIIVKWIKGGQEVVNSQGNLISECKEWMGRSWITNLQHIYREGSHVANLLPKK